MDKIPLDANYDEIKVRIRNIRERKGISQEKVAEALNVNRTTYTRCETGNTKITIQMLIKLSRIFDVPYSDFFEPSGAPFGDDALHALAGEKNKLIMSLNAYEVNLILESRMLDSSQKQELRSLLDSLLEKK